MKIGNIELLALAFFIGWIIMSLFLGKLHISLKERGLSSTIVGLILISISAGLFFGTRYISEDLIRDTILSIEFIGFLIGVGLIRIGLYKFFYGSDWKDRKK
jgi:hypothetical protein